MTGRLATVAALVASLVLVATTADASATFAGRNGLVSYSVGGGEENWVLRAVRSDGTHDRRLLGPTRSGGGFYRGPSGGQWSADGKRLLFGGQSHLDREATSLWYATASGKRPRQIPLGLPRPLRLYGWAWAPDGRHVVFAAGGPNSTAARIYRIAIDGSHRRRLARGDRPAWSGDGRYIVFEREYASVGDRPARKGVFIMRSSGRDLRRLTASTDDRQPSFSPDSRRVAYLRSSGRRTEWHTVGIDGSSDVLVAAHTGASQAPFVRFGAPQFTPDGKRLAALREQTGDTGTQAECTLVTIGPTGGDERVELTFTRTLDPFVFGYAYYAGAFAWQPR